MSWTEINNTNAVDYYTEYEHVYEARRAIYNSVDLSSQNAKKPHLATFSIQTTCKHNKETFYLIEVYCNYSTTQLSFRIRH